MSRSAKMWAGRIKEKTNSTKNKKFGLPKSELKRTFESMINYTSEVTSRILCVAEKLFADRGYHGTSVRDITEEAGVNLAAVNYHFGDKKSLYEQIVTTFLRAINQRRLANLQSSKIERNGQPIPLTVIIDIFARPLFELCESPRGTSSLRLIGRAMVEPLPFIDELLAVELHPVMLQFSQAVRRHVPTLTPGEFMWRLTFVVGAMHHTLATMHRMKELTKGICQDNDATEALKHFIQFASLTLHAAPGIASL